MEIRVLRYFLAIAREENITGAANLLHVTQPTLSRQIKDLEDELDQKLLVRGSHRVTLTPEGMLLRKRAEEIIAIVDKTEEEFSAMKGPLGGDIHIGSGETHAMNLIAAVCRRIQKRYPGIHYHLHCGSAEEIAERLDQGRLDFGILTQPTDMTKYDYLSIPVEDTWGIMMRRDSPLAEKKEIQVWDLAGLPLIVPREAMQQRTGNNKLAEWFGEEWTKLNIVATFDLCSSAAILAKQGIGYVVLQDQLADTSDSSPLCFRPFAPGLVSGLDIVWKKYQVFSSAAELFLKELNDSFERRMTMNELLLKTTGTDGKSHLSVVEPSDGSPVYTLTQKKDSLLKESFVIQSGSGDEVASIKMEHILFTPGKMPKLTLSTKDGKHFVVKKEIEQLRDIIRIEGEGLSVKGDLYSEHFELLCGDQCIAAFTYDDAGKMIRADENYELIAVMFAFALELIN